MAFFFFAITLLLAFDARVSPPVWPRITLGGGVERSRATDAASSEANRYAGRAVRLLSRVATGPLHGGAGHSAWPNAHYVINAVGKFNAAAASQDDPVKDCASQQLQRPISGKATTRLRQSLVRRARLKLGFRASCALLERTSSKWTYRQLLGALSLISSSVPHTKPCCAAALRDFHVGEPFLLCHFSPPQDGSHAKKRREHITLPAR